MTVHKVLMKESETRSKFTQSHFEFSLMGNQIYFTKQECIPVGCVPPASVAISGGGEVVCLRGCLPRRRLPGGVCPGWCVCPGGYVSA